MWASRRVLALTLAAVALVAITAESGTVLASVPVLVLCAVLAFLGYVGEDAIDRLRARAHRTRARRLRTPAPRLRDALVSVPRGAALLASGRAVRPPPALLRAF